MPNNHLLLSLPNTESSRQAIELLRQQLPQCQIIEHSGDCQQHAACHWLQPLTADSLGAVQASLTDAIEVLERSRHAFKSAALAELRKRLSLLNQQLSALANYATKPTDI